MLSEHLQKLNEVIDADVVDRAYERMRAALLYEPVDRLPIIIDCPVPGWKTFPYREAFSDMEKMLLNELHSVWVGANVCDDRMYTIRANYGVGIIPSMFGCKIELTDNNNMPWCHPLDDEKLDKVLESGEVDIYSGLGSRVFETIQFFKDTLTGYDKLSRYIRIYVCDTQGPFDIAHLIMGTKIYTEMYDNPTRVHRLLELTTKAYIMITRAVKELTTEDCEWSYHSRMLSQGGIRICEDSSINISTPCYREFSRPYNEIVLKEFNGGWIHYCGSGHQIQAEVLSTPGVKGINFGNPEMQDIEYLHTSAGERKIPVLGWVLQTPLPDGIKTGMTLITAARNLESAKAQLNRR